ncbi:DUF3048 domain-containing protein [Sporotomaculum syntrophicum]|nr:DUF3048 domain-containing protein [Sporotomaculum syntrophicum]
MERPGENNSPEMEFNRPQDNVPASAMLARPIAVTIDNSSSARPQSGLDQADLVYEVPVEGGVTRYLAVFFHEGTKNIGPIRSARPYLIELAREWDAIYIHCGQSPQAQTYFAENQIAHINEMFHPTGFWRDKSRQAPFNLYTDINSLWQEITKLGWDNKGALADYPLRGAGDQLSGQVAEKLTIIYPYGRVGYQYDAPTNTYLRFLNDRPYLDLNSSMQLSAVNILIQQVSMWAFDSEGRLEVNLLGQGKAWLFSNGQVQEATWRKNSNTSRTRFYDQTGVELSMTKGTTWIQLISEQMQFNYK